MDDTLAKDIMSTQVVSIQDDTTLEEAIKVLVNQGYSGLPVVNQQGEMVGVFSDFDVLHHIATSKGPLGATCLEKIRYSKDATSIPDNTPLQKITELFVEKRFRRLPVLNAQKKILGIVTRRDLMKTLYYRMKLPE